MNSCAVKLDKEENKHVVTPEYQDDKKIQVAKFVNLSGDEDLDIYEQTIPQFLIYDLSNVSQIRLQSKQVILKNKDKILSAYKYIEHQRNEEMNDIMDDLTDSSQKVFKKPQQQEKPLKSKKNETSKLSKTIQNKKKEITNIHKYLDFYEKNRLPFKKYLGVNINKPFKITSTTSKLTTLDKILVLKSKNVFNLNKIYPQLSKSPADLTFIGIIRKKGQQLVVHVRLYDKHNIQFIIKKTFKFPLNDLMEKMEKNIKTISKTLIDELTQFPKGSLSIKTFPKDAFIYIDDKHVGKSNFKKKLPIGLHKIDILKKGYKKITGHVYVVKEKKIKLSFKLYKESSFGSLYITSYPLNADVYVDLDYKGKTPLHIKKIKAGTYKIRLEKKGYQFSYSHVTVKPGKGIKSSHVLVKGETKFVDVDKLSKKYNTTKNIFFYASFISISAMIYAYLRAGKFSDRTSSATTLYEYNHYYTKYKQANNFKNITIGTTIGLLVLTAVFQILEIHAEDIEVGFTPKIDEKQKTPTIKENKDIGATFKLQLRF